MRNSMLLLVVLAACERTDKPAETTAKTTPAAPAAQTPATAQAPTATPLQPGAAAPDIDAVTHDGKAVKLSELRGKPVVVYFYPKDDTPGCTAEAKAFAARREDFEKHGAQVIGVSGQDNESHKAFAEKYALNFPLVPDTDGKIAAAWGVPMRGTYAARTTFIVGKDGKVVKTFEKVQVDGHDAEVLAAVEEAAKM